jgi:2-octaprenyl-6-methoxyphenol hydroxylase
MESEAEAQRLLALDDSGFEREANARSLGVFGPLTLVSRRMAWPVISLLADRLAGRRTALIAETAHVAPPVGAQGLNMSLADAAALSTAVAGALERGEDIGGGATLASYEKARLGDIRARIAATAALTIAADGLIRPVRTARALGLATLGAVTPARRAAMRFGLGG